MKDREIDRDNKNQERETKLVVTGLEKPTGVLSYLEQFSKVGTASGEYDAMRFEALAIAGQCDVHEILIVPQVLKRCRDTALVIVPSQAKVLRIYHR